MAQSKGVYNFDEKNDCVVIENKNKTKSIHVYSYHISCQSDAFDGISDMLGIVLYEYEGKTEWKLNGIRCKSGYIYLCQSKNLKNISSKPVNSWHARCYKKLFNQDPDFTKLIAGGFAFQDGQWKFSSGTYNAPNGRKDKIKKYYKLDRFIDDWHDNNRDMNPSEIKWIENTINKWVESGERTLYIRPIVWSWLRHKWIEYDIETNRFLEEEYSKFNEGINEKK
eukprot:764632_1